jgi:hypothetical protein
MRRRGGICKPQRQVPCEVPGARLSAWPVWRGCSCYSAARLPSAPAPNAMCRIGGIGVLSRPRMHATTARLSSSKPQAAQAFAALRATALQKSSIAALWFRDRWRVWAGRRISLGRFVVAVRRIDAEVEVVTRTQIGIRQLPRRPSGCARGIVETPSCPDQPAQHHQKRYLEDQPQIRRNTAKPAEQSATEHKPEQAGAKKAGRKAAQDSAAIE